MLSKNTLELAIEAIEHYATTKFGHDYGGIESAISELRQALKEQPQEVLGEAWMILNSDGELTKLHLYKYEPTVHHTMQAVKVRLARVEE